MNCEELIRYLSDYIDNELDSQLRADAQEHLATCHNCSNVLDTTRQTITLYRNINRQTIPLSRRSSLFKSLQLALKKRDKAQGLAEKAPS
jgi:predicted anti-sigma-YlaC factor YlaD